MPRNPRTGSTTWSRKTKPTPARSAERIAADEFRDECDTITLHHLAVALTPHDDYERDLAYHAATGRWPNDS